MIWHPRFLHRPATHTRPHVFSLLGSAQRHNPQGFGQIRDDDKRNGWPVVQDGSKALDSAAIFVVYARLTEPHQFVQHSGCRVAQYCFRLLCINQHAHHGDTLLALLSSETMDVLIQRSNTRSEGLAVMLVRVKQLLLKHDEPFALRPRRFAMQRWV